MVMIKAKDVLVVPTEDVAKAMAEMFEPGLPWTGRSQDERHAWNEAVTAVHKALTHAAARHEAGRTFTCTTCRDTHMMPMSTSSGDDREVMCTRCPLPCQKCRMGGYGAFCETTPCSCACHRAQGFPVG